MAKLFDPPTHHDTSATSVTNRYQRVAINNCFSDLLPIISGVPQGSILGCLFFLVYINDMPEYIRHVPLLIFADDTKCLKHIYQYYHA